MCITNKKMGGEGNELNSLIICSTKLLTHYIVNICNKSTLDMLHYICLLFLKTLSSYFELASELHVF